MSNKIHINIAAKSYRASAKIIFLNGKSQHSYLMCRASVTRVKKIFLPKLFKQPKPKPNLNFQIYRKRKKILV